MDNGLIRDWLLWSIQNKLVGMAGCYDSTSLRQCIKRARAERRSGRMGRIRIEKISMYPFAQKFYYYCYIF